MSLSAYVNGVGVLGPGLADWTTTSAVLTGTATYVAAATRLPVPELLPAAERRRTGRVVKLAIAVALEATTRAGADAGTLASIFSSSGGDGHNCHEICATLAGAERAISPTRFTNSVHNAASGYWSIATSSMAPSNVLCAFDASFGAGLLEALTQTTVEQRATLLVTYDTEYPPPLHAKRDIPDGFGIALVLTPERSSRSLAKLTVALTRQAAEAMSDPELEALRRSIPAARGLPLLSAIARRWPGHTILDYLEESRLDVAVEPCG
jgi:hypothetical protein